jgi:hypothetical protein
VKEWQVVEVNQLAGKTLIPLSAGSSKVVGGGSAYGLEL